MSVISPEESPIARYSMYLVEFLTSLKIKLILLFFSGRVVFKQLKETNAFFNEIFPHRGLMRFVQKVPNINRAIVPRQINNARSGGRKLCACVKTLL